jgi:hypothetical protein
MSYLGGMAAVRGDLETAIGVVLTSRSARDMVLDDPAGFAAHFSLNPDEVLALAAMSDDLVALMPGFVRKRERGLRQVLGLTLSLLGDDEATALIEDYSDGYAPLPSTAADTLRFADFVIEQIREMADELPYGDIIADVARLQRLRLATFGTERPLWPAPEQAPLDPWHIDPERPLWLDASATVEDFGWDVRTVRSPAALPRLRPDPASLLFFQQPGASEVIILRVDSECAQAVRLIAARPGGLTAGQAGQLAGSHRPAEALLGKLIAHGVIKGTPS